MEKYWCLRWLKQEQKMHVKGTVIKTDKLLIKELPMICKVNLPKGIGLGAVVVVKINHIDLLSLNCDVEVLGD